jgi:hypothetical protein
MFRSSLRGKLAVLIAGASFCTAVLAAAAFSGWDVTRYRHERQVERSVVAGILAGQAGRALALRDRPAAAEVLGSLRADQGIRNAAIFDAGGECFAVFSRTDGQGCAGGADIYSDEDEAAAVSKTEILRGGERVGMLVLVSSERTTASVFAQYVGEAALILAFSLLAGVYKISASFRANHSCGTIYGECRV